MSSSLCLPPLVLVVPDFATRRQNLLLTARCGSLEPVLEGGLVLS